MKVLSLVLFGVLIYGGIFGVHYTQNSRELRLLSASATFTQKDQLGLLDGLHNGFAVPGAVAGNYCMWLVALIGDLWVVDEAEGRPLGLIAGFIAGVINFVISGAGFLITAVLGFFLHLLFYIALLIKLLFVAATPAYHVGLLIGTGVTWLLFTAVSAMNDSQSSGSPSAPVD